MIHSFIIKIWREEPEKGKLPKWKGHITHVPDFVNIYLQRMGIRVGLRWRWKQWLVNRSRLNKENRK